MTSTITNFQLNQMNEVLNDMRRLKSRQRAPLFTVNQITQQWHILVDDTASEAFVASILNEGAKTGFFLVQQSLDGSLSYGYNANMLAFNPQNRFILEAALPETAACLNPCNLPRHPKVVGIPATPSNCCYTMNKGSGFPCNSCSTGVPSGLSLSLSFCGVATNLNGGGPYGVCGNLAGGFGGSDGGCC